MDIHRGTIEGFSGSYTSGMAVLLIRDSETGKVERVPCDNGPTVRALRHAFGPEVITGGHCVDVPAFRGREILWQWDELGLCLGGFVPVEQAEEVV